MKITVFKDERSLARTLAAQIAAMLTGQPDLVFGLPTGRTPVRLYHELGTLYTQRLADFSQATTFNLDEFLGVGPDDPGSYRAFMQTHLFSRVNLSPERIHLLHGSAPDPEGECARYEQEIADAGGIDLQLLGIGTNGHIGFNEPARELAARTHRVTLKESTRRSNAALFGGAAGKVPKEALSMGMATILHARRIVLVATGKSKAHCIEQVVKGPITTKLPASFLQLHLDVELMLDEAAAAALGGSEPPLFPSNRPGAAGDVVAARLGVQRPRPRALVAVEGRGERDLGLVVGGEVVLGGHLLAVEGDGPERRLVGGLAGHRDLAGHRPFFRLLERELEAAARTGPLPGAGPDAGEIRRLRRSLGPALRRRETDRRGDE